MRYLPIAILLSILVAIGYSTIQLSHKNSAKIAILEGEASQQEEGDSGDFIKTNIQLPDFYLSELFLAHETLSKADFVSDKPVNEIENSKFSSKKNGGKFSRKIMRKKHSEKPYAANDGKNKSSASESEQDSDKIEKASNHKRFVLVNFFASWCTTCKAEHEILMRLQSENIIDIYGIAWRDIEKETKKFLKTQGNPYKKVGVDSSGLFTKIASINAVPETWIVNQDGVVVRKIVGNMQEYTIDEIKDFLAKELR